MALITTPYAQFNQPNRPINKIIAITPSDTDGLPSGPCRAIFATVAGNAQIVDMQGNSVVVPLVIGRNDVAAQQVLSTLTTATGLKAGY